MKRRISMLAGPAVFASIVAIMEAPYNAVAASGLVDPTFAPTDNPTVVDTNGVVADEPVLQSVLMSSGRKLAVINGQAFKIGDKVGDATLLKVSDHGAVLRNSDKTLQTLSMYPGVQKKVKVPMKQRSSVKVKTKRAMSRIEQAK